MIKTINAENKALQQQTINIQTKKPQRAISNLKPTPEAALPTQIEIRSKSNIKEPNPQMNNYLLEK